jgi:hypothetical protein
LNLKEKEKIMVRIVVDNGYERTFRNLYADWRQSLGDSIIAFPPQSAGTLVGDKVIGTTFNNVPEEFLEILDDNGEIKFRVES